MNIVVFCPNLIGDTVMATPAIRALREHFPGARLTALVRPQVAPVLDGNPWFDEVVRAHHKSGRIEERNPAVIRRLRQGRHDVAILLPNSFRSAWTAWRSGIPRRVGYVRYGRGLLLTDRLLPPRDATGKYLPTPIVEYYLALAGLLGCRGASVRLELRTTDDDERAADRAAAILGLGGDRPLVCLNTGGAFGPAKNWPAASFAEVARRLVAERGASVLVLCGPAERDSAREIVRLADHPDVASLADLPTSLGLSKAFVRRASLLVTTDSGPRHFAAAFGTPVVTLFGPTHIAWTRTYHPAAVHLIRPVPCGPCQRPVCPEGHHRCMRELSPESVFHAACRLLDGGSHRRTGRHPGEALTRRGTIGQEAGA
ncbi:ADP-heptose--LPS heptosyltransferase 2 [Aquisphaera giovannonii]|uniref:lipopolysaccharide heptosyltransferase II n=1 Tax=Aquisphaera giovannonii TaxID=406548 RepID=A0A5B9WAP1_9BACT|nr:lipopolysaccharide heptosyltransferase II [Aquisphaera giovannonii]QEH37324.1 ADP-heptose--LPS heptosyltransferase 2 [Aquisphaera giovannonii]